MIVIGWVIVVGACIAVDALVKFKFDGSVKPFAHAGNHWPDRKVNVMVNASKRTMRKRARAHLMAVPPTLAAAQDAEANRA